MVPWQTSGMTYYFRKLGGQVYLPLFSAHDPIYDDGDKIHREQQPPASIVRQYDFNGWNVTFIICDDDIDELEADTYVHTGRNGLSTSSPYVKLPIQGTIQGTALNNIGSIDKWATSIDNHNALQIKTEDSEINPGGIEPGDELKFTYMDIQTDKVPSPIGYFPARWICKGRVADVRKYDFVTL